jgi:hypothetical protein
MSQLSKTRHRRVLEAQFQAALQAAQPVETEAGTDTEGEGASPYAKLQSNTRRTFGRNKRKHKLHRRQQ